MNNIKLPYLKVGDIVRRKTHFGNTRGAYIIITSIRKSGIYGKYLDNTYTNEFWIIGIDYCNENTFKVYKRYAIQVSNNDFNCIEYSGVIYHRTCKQYEKAFNINPEILKVFSRSGRYMYVRDPYFTKILKKNKPTIKVVLNSIIYVSRSILRTILR